MRAYLYTASRPECVLSVLARCQNFGKLFHDFVFRQQRVRVRQNVLPVLETQLGPGIADALARTAAQLREDAEAFEEMIDETIEDIVERGFARLA